MAKVLSEAVTLLLAPESSFATQPTSGWVQVQPNPGGIQRWVPTFAVVERDPLSKYASMEAGDIVGQNAEPTIAHDLTKDLLDIVAGAVFRSDGKHAGGNDVSLFRPTAVTSTGYTVAADGDLADGILIYAAGFSTAANNGLKVTAGTSTATEIKAAGLTAEASPPSNATVEVAGVQGATGDIMINADGNLTSTALDFTTLGLNAGQWIKIGGSTAATQFATTAYNGRAKIVSVAANLITLERRSWTVASADNGATKTIQLFFSRWYRNVSIDHVDYDEPTLHGELEELGPGAAGVATYTYGTGLALNTLELDAPLESKIVATMSFQGKDIQDPVVVASRATGADAPRRPMGARLFHTASPSLVRVRLAQASDDSVIAAEVNSWRLTFNNNVKPREIQGTLGCVDMIYGKFQPSLSMEVYYTTVEAAEALRDNRGAQFDVQVRNDDAGFIIDLPNVRVRGGARTYAANEAVMCSLDVPAFRDTSDNIVASLSVFAHMPEDP